MVDLTAMQQEQIEWSVRNFGQQPARLPHLGIIEELAELGIAYVNDNVPEVLDAIGDAGIYALDFCGKKGWNLADFWNDRQWFPDEPMASMPITCIYTLIMRFAHHQLKGEQGIRGGAEHHEQQMQQTLRALMLTLDRFSKNYLETDFLLVIDKVWAKVRLRDWTKNPTNAHEVASS